MTAANFYQRIQQETAAEREYLLSSPLITSALTGNLTLDEYISFLAQAYHHVKHTTPLLMAVGSRIPESQEWLRDKIAHKKQNKKKKKAIKTHFLIKSR